MNERLVLLAVRQTAAGFEVYDSNGARCGVAVSPDHLWTILAGAVATAQPTELPAPEQVAIEKVVRETSSFIGSFLENRHPGAVSFARNVIRGAVVAQRHGLFDK